MYTVNFPLLPTATQQRLQPGKTPFRSPSCGVHAERHDSRISILRASIYRHLIMWDGVQTRETSSFQPVSSYISHGGWQHAGEHQLSLCTHWVQISHHAICLKCASSVFTVSPRPMSSPYVSHRRRNRQCIYKFISFSRIASESCLPMLQIARPPGR